MYTASNVLLEDVFDYKDVEDLFNFESDGDFIKKLNLYCSLLGKTDIIKELDMSGIFKNVSDLHDIDSQTLRDIQIIKNFIEDTAKKSKIKGLDISLITRNMNPLAIEIAGRVVDKIKKNDINSIGKIISDFTTDFKKIIVEFISKIDSSDLRLGTMLSILVTVLSICIILIFTFVLSNLGVGGIMSGSIAVSLGSLFSVILLTEKSRIFTIAKGFGNDFKFSSNEKILGDIISSEMWAARINNILSLFSDVFINITHNQAMNTFVNIVIQLVANIPKSNVVGGTLMGDNPVFVDTSNIIRSLEDPSFNGVSA